MSCPRASSYSPALRASLARPYFARTLDGSLATMRRKVSMRSVLKGTLQEMADSAHGVFRRLIGRVVRHVPDRLDCRARDARRERFGDRRGGDRVGVTGGDDRR